MTSRGIVSVALLTAALLTGCGDQQHEAGGVPSPSSQRSGSPAATPSASPSPSATSRASVSRQDEQATLRASAEQFAREYFRTFNAVSHDHDFSKVAPLYLPTCTGCNKDLEYVRDEARRGLRAVGNDYELLSVRAGEVSATSAAVRVVTRGKRGQLVNSKGDAVEGLKGWEDSPAVVRLVRVGSSWKF